MDPWFSRQDEHVKLELDSGLGTCKPVYLFWHKCTSQEEAELVARHFQEVMDEYKSKIARNPVLYLERWEVSELKRKLANWSTRTDNWK